MKPLAHQSQAGKSMFVSAVNGLGNVVAIIVTFLATPPTYSATVFWVQDFTARHYGAGYEEKQTLFRTGLFSIPKFLSKEKIPRRLSLKAIWGI